MNYGKKINKMRVDGGSGGSNGTDKPRFLGGDYETRLYSETILHSDVFMKRFYFWTLPPPSLPPPLAQCANMGTQSAH